MPARSGYFSSGRMGAPVRCKHLELSVYFVERARCASVPDHCAFRLTMNDALA